MDVSAVLGEQSGDHPGGIVGVLGGVHGRRGRGKRMPAVVDLEESVAVAAVTNDVVARIGTRAAGLLRGDGRQKVGVDAVPARGCRRFPVRRQRPGKRGGRRSGSIVMAPAHSPDAGV